MKLEGCVYCDGKSDNLFLINYEGVEFYLCEDCLYFFFKANKVDHCWSPAAMRFGGYDGELKCESCQL